MSNISTILQGLISRTEDGKLNWRQGVRKNVLLTSVDTTGIIIRELDEFGEQYRLEILDDRGEKAVAIETDDAIGLVPKERLATKEQAEALSRLYKSARDSAFPHPALEKLARDLRTNWIAHSFRHPLSRYSGRGLML